MKEIDSFTGCREGKKLRKKDNDDDQKKGKKDGTGLLIDSQQPD